MPDDIEKINQIFKSHDEKAEQNSADRAQENAGAEKRKRTPSIKSVDELLIDTSGGERSNYTGDAESERDYLPVRQSHESKSGCLGGLMFFTFIACISIIFACVAWMAASDMLALNQKDFTAVISLPSTIFTSETVDTVDEKGEKTGTKRVTHADIDYVADVLKDAGLVEYKWLFETFCKISKADAKLSPGEYELKSTYDYRALIQHMRSGSSSTVTVTVTIPEGYTMHQIFKKLEEKGVCSYEELMEAASGYSFNYDFLDNTETDGSYDSKRLEGFLFPDTYEFYVGMQASSAINKMLENFHYRTTDAMKAQAETLGLSFTDIINIASLIEREAANDNERNVIASVIYNRLNRGMLLGIDAAVLYPYPDHEGAPTGEMLRADDPYNTRINPGLPPTPICNPGLASINAALYPENTYYTYYALDTETGEHRFFTDETEFANFVATQDYS